MSKRDHLPSWQKGLEQQKNDRDKNRQLAGKAETDEEPDWTSLGYISPFTIQAQMNAAIQSAAQVAAFTSIPQHQLWQAPVTTFGASSGWSTTNASLPPIGAGPLYPAYTTPQRYVTGIGESKPLPQRQESGAYRAWRMWGVKPDGTLTAVSRDYDWKPGATKAECHSGWGYSCGCGGKGGDIHRLQALEEHPPGVYGYKTFKEMYDDEPWATRSVMGGDPATDRGKKLVTGTVLLWGKMTVAERGMRAEWGMPEMLFVPDVGSDSYWHMLQQAAKRYGMERIDRQQIDALPTGLIRLRQDGSIEEK